MNLHLLHVGVMLSIIKVFMLLFLLWEQGISSGYFQNKYTSPPFNWVTQYILFLAKVKGREKWIKGGQIMRLTPGGLGCHKGWKSFFFCEIWSNPTPPHPLCFLLDLLTKKYFMKCSSVINLWIDSRYSKSEKSCCQLVKGIAIT